VVKRFLSEWNFQKRSLGLYLTFSVVAAAIILSTTIDYTLGANTSWSYVALGYPFVLSFFALNSYVFCVLRPYVGLIAPDLHLLGFFLCQFIGLQLIGISQGRVEYFYLATMPIVAILFGIQSDWSSSPRFKLRMATVVLALASFSFLSFLMHPKFSGEWPLSVTLLGAFCLWQFGTIYLANVEWMRMSRETLKSFLETKKESDRDFYLHPAERERYFFHDVINHTHGMGLLLRYRLMKNRGLTHEEAMAFSNELEALQTLVKEHFGYGHKNLAGCSEQQSWRPFGELKNLTYNLIQSYFPEGQTEAYFIFKGSLAEDSGHDPLLPFVPFHRIITNMIKNCSEAKSSKVEVIFAGNHKELTLTVKNDVYKNRTYGYDLGRTLEKIISSEEEKGKQNGVGLESIESLCQALGGAFNFFIENGHWVAQVTIPFKTPILWKEGKSPETGEKKVA
jgi:hypothetical protein